MIWSVALLTVQACGENLSVSKRPLDEAGRDVAESFVTAAISGDGDVASRLLIPAVSPIEILEFAEDHSEDDLRIDGLPKVVGNRATYRVQGKEMGPYPARIRASFTVWMIQMDGGWRVSDWWYHIEERTTIGRPPKLPR